jgi:hypothetical protein
VRHQIFVPLLSDPTQFRESDAIAAGDGRFRLVGGARGAEPLLFKPGEIVECAIQTMPGGFKGLVATRSVSADPEYRSWRTIYAVTGAFVGAVFGAAFALMFVVTLTSAFIGAAVGATTFALCSIRWGDSAWTILSRLVRWR